MSVEIKIQTILRFLVTLLEPSLCRFQLPVIIQTIIINLWLCQL
jgi:hypothetical protein